MVNWIQVGALGCSLGEVPKTELLRALALTCEDPGRALDLIRLVSSSQVVSHGISVNPFSGAAGRSDIETTPKDAPPPAVFVLVVRDASRRPAEDSLLAKALSRSPVVLLAHCEPGRTVGPHLRALQNGIQGFDSQTISWVDLSTSGDGDRHPTWPAELLPEAPVPLKASAIRRSSVRSPVTEAGAHLALTLDAPWCWVETRPSKPEKGTLSDPSKALRRKLVELVTEWLDAPDKTVTVVATGRGADPAALHPDLAPVLAPGAPGGIAWQRVEPPAPLTVRLSRASAAETAQLRDDLDRATTLRPVTPEASPSPKGDPIQAYKALVKGQSDSLANVRPADPTRTIQQLVAQADQETERFVQLLTTHAEARLKLRNTAPALLSRLAVAQTDLIHEETRAFTDAREKRTDPSVILRLTDGARSEIVQRTLAVLDGLTAGQAHLLRLYWLRRLRPRYTDIVKSELGDASANPRLPEIDAVHSSFKPLVGHPVEVRRRLEERMKWPGEQRVPTAWNPKQIKGQSRKFTRILAVGVGIVALAGFTGAALSDGFNRYVAREEVVRSDDPGCPSHYAEWHIPGNENGAQDDQEKRKGGVLEKVLDTLDNSVLGEIASGQDQRIVRDAIIASVQSGKPLIRVSPAWQNLWGWLLPKDPSGLDMTDATWETAAEQRNGLRWLAEVEYTRLRDKIADCTETDNEQRAATGRQMLDEMSAIAQAWAFLAFSVTVLVTTNWLLTSLLLLLLALNIWLAFKTIVLTRRDMKLDKIATIEQGASNAVDGILLEVFGEWRRHLEVERKAFLERFAEQIARSLGRPGEDAI
ncbi:MAG: hypothetical protein AAGF09_04275, partial [Pseudomonadota bacterium]